MNSEVDDRASLESATGRLFGELWSPYDDRLFEDSVQLFPRRLQLAGFELEWFKGKKCLDAGCGGGRNSVAMGRLGASQVIGIDIGEEGLENARLRAKGMPNVEFKYTSILDTPFPDGAFDLVWCAGVLMTTAEEERGLDELARITKSGGHLYLLVYATGGVRWPLIQLLRPLASQIGLPDVEHAITLAALPPNKRRTFLDDLFCPQLEFYHWHRLARMLRERNFLEIQRWGPVCRLDHETNLETYRQDLEALLSLFAAGADGQPGPNSALFKAGQKAIKSTMDGIRWFENAVCQGHIPLNEAMDRVIGQGHHRVMAVKG